VVYAPTAETGSGNDLDAVAGWRTVANANSTKAVAYPYVQASTFTGWTAVNNNDGTYQKATNVLKEGLTTTGALVQIYVWMEGTDADCLVTTATEAQDNNTYQVALNFVGATTTAASSGSGN